MVKLADTNRSRAWFRADKWKVKRLKDTVKEVFEVNFPLCGFEGVEDTPRNSGDDGKREPPVPIPNTEVKPLSAEGTWLATARENRTPPDSREGISDYPLNYN